MKLLRYKSTKSKGELVSLEDYVDRVKDDQNSIYYITCASAKACESTPVLEKFLQKGYEVLLFDEPIDEYVAQSLQEYEGLECVNVLRENAKLPESKGFEKLAASEDMTSLKAWFEKVLGDDISSAVVSNKLATSPAGCSASTYGYTGNMERIMKAQAMNTGTSMMGMSAKSVFEFNPYHPIVKELNERRKADEKDEQAVEMAKLLLDSAMLSSGYSMKEPDAFAKRIHKLVSLGLDLDPEAEITATEPEEEEDEEEEAEAAGEEAEDVEELD